MQIASLLSQLAEADASKQKAFSLMQAEINRLSAEREDSVRQLQNRLKEANTKSDMDRAAAVA